MNKIIDIHQHIYIKSDPTLEKLLQYMTRNNIERVLAIGSASPHAGDNEDVLRAVTGFPDRFVGAVYVDPREKDVACDAVRRYYDHGFKAVKMLPFHGYYPDDPMAFPVYELVIEFGMLMMFHSGGGGSSPGVKYRGMVKAEDFSRKYGLVWNFDNIGHRYPEMRILLAHMGANFNLAETFSVLACHKNVYLDTSCSTAMQMLKEVLRQDNKYVKPLDVGRLVWGRDGLQAPDYEGESPFLREQREIIGRLCGNDGVTMDKVFQGNASMLLGLEDQKG